jgi:hypothetical protein
MDEPYSSSIKLGITLTTFLELLTLGSIETILSEQDRYSPVLQRFTEDWRRQTSKRQL